MENKTTGTSVGASKLKEFLGACGRFLQKYSYFFAKIGISLVTLALSVIVLFFLLRMIPGDIVELYALKLQNQQGITFDRAYELAAQLLNYDPNENIFQAFGRYVGGLFRGELGNSYLETGVSANSLIATRLPWTLFISSVSLFISFFIGIAVGGFVAQKRKGIANKVASGYIAVSGSVPDYLIALILVIVFAYQLRWFPAQNNYDAFAVTPDSICRFCSTCSTMPFCPFSPTPSCRPATGSCICAEAVSASWARTTSLPPARADWANGSSAANT